MKLWRGGVPNDCLLAGRASIRGPGWPQRNKEGVEKCRVPYFVRVITIVCQLSRVRKKVDDSRASSTKLIGTIIIFSIISR
jgi:hypothetical protein